MHSRRRLLMASLTVILLLPGGRALAQIADAPPDTVAGIPVNYVESRVGGYTLPDPLVMANGAAVSDEAMWFGQRRPEILRLFEEHQFGRVPGKPAEMTFDVFDAGTPALEGKATRRQVTLYFDAERTEPAMDLLLYLPAEATGRSSSTSSGCTCCPPTEAACLAYRKLAQSLGGASPAKRPAIQAMTSGSAAGPTLT